MLKKKNQEQDAKFKKTISDSLKDGSSTAGKEMAKLKKEKKMKAKK